MVVKGLPQDFTGKFGSLSQFCFEPNMVNCVVQYIFAKSNPLFSRSENKRQTRWQNLTISAKRCDKAFTSRGHERDRFSLSILPLPSTIIWWLEMLISSLNSSNTLVSFSKKKTSPGGHKSKRISTLLHRSPPRYYSVTYLEDKTNDPQMSDAKLGLPCIKTSPTAKYGSRDL